MKFWKIELAFLFQKWFDIYLKQHFDILFIECKMNQTTSSSRWPNSKPESMNKKNEPSPSHNDSWAKYFKYMHNDK